MRKTKQGNNRLLKKIIAVDDLINDSTTVGGIILSAKFGKKKATIDSKGNILINVSISRSENLKTDLNTVEHWANRPIVISMEYEQVNDNLLPVIVPLIKSARLTPTYSTS